MHCPACNYDLAGLPAGRCPECARPFDPAFPPHAEQRRFALGRRRGIVSLLLAPSILYAYAVIISCYLVAWIEFGHRPQPSLNEAEGAVTTVFRLLAVLSMCAAPFLAIGAVVCAIDAAILQRRYLRWSLVALLAIAAVPATVALIRIDPGGIIGWFAD